MTDQTPEQTPESNAADASANPNPPAPAGDAAPPAAAAPTTGDAAAPAAPAAAGDAGHGHGSDHEGDHGAHDEVAAQAEGLNTPIIFFVGMFIATASLLMVFSASAIYYEGQHIENARKQRYYDERAAAEREAAAANAPDPNKVHWTTEPGRVSIPVDRAIDAALDDQDFGPVSSVEPANNASD